MWCHPDFVYGYGVVISPMYGRSEGILGMRWVRVISLDLGVTQLGRWPLTTDILVLPCLQGNPACTVEGGPKKKGMFAPITSFNTQYDGEYRSHNLWQQIFGVGAEYGYNWSILVPGNQNGMERVRRCPRYWNTLIQSNLVRLRGKHYGTLTIEGYWTSGKPPEPAQTSRRYLTIVIPRSPSKAQCASSSSRLSYKAWIIAANPQWWQQIPSNCARPAGSGGAIWSYCKIA